MWGLRFTAAAAALVIAGCAGQSGPETTVVGAEPQAQEPQNSRADAPTPRATQAARRPSPPLTETVQETAGRGDFIPEVWGPRAIDIGDYDAYVSTAVAAAAPPPVHLGDYDARHAAAAPQGPAPVHVGDYDQRRAAAAAPRPRTVHVRQRAPQQRIAAAPRPSPVHVGDYDQHRAAAAAPRPRTAHVRQRAPQRRIAAAPRPSPVHVGDYDQHRAAAAAPRRRTVHVRQRAPQQRIAAAPRPNPVHVGDYDQHRAAARFGPASSPLERAVRGGDRWTARPAPIQAAPTRAAPTRAAPNSRASTPSTSSRPAAPRPRLRRTALRNARSRSAAARNVAARALSTPTIQAAAVTSLMTPVYDAGDFAPQTPGSSSGELKAPPPRGQAGSSRRARYDSGVARSLAASAMERTRHRVRYDGRYVELAYPWGDVPSDIGVCTDVVVRTYRGVGVDLQKLLHEDIRGAFSDYPSRRVYGKSSPDRNIDHRRVVNLERFLERQGASLPLSYDPESFQPGDVVSWRLNGTQPHIGVVVEDRDPTTGFPLVVHNIGSGPKADNILALQEPVGHYRYTPPGDTRVAMR